MVIGNTQLGEGAQHAFRRLAAQLSRFDFEIARQHCADGRHGHLQALTAVWRTADDIQQTVTAHVYFCYAQFVSVRVLTALDYFADDHAVEGSGNRLNTVHFQTRHGDLVRKRVAVQRGVHPLA